MCVAKWKCTYRIAVPQAVPARYSIAVFALYVRLAFLIWSQLGIHCVEGRMDESPTKIIIQWVQIGPEVLDYILD